jgi:hypothetical protein
MNRDDLAKLRAEIAGDLERRQRRAAEDPFYDDISARPLVRKSAHNGVLTYSTKHDAYIPPAADDEPDDGGAFFGDYRDELLTDAIGEALAGLRRELRSQFNRKIATLEGELTETKGLLGDALRKIDTLSRSRKPPRG